MNRRDNLGSSVHDTGKVFAMCKEYDYIRNFLDTNPEIKGNPEFKKICMIPAEWISKKLNIQTDKIPKWLDSGKLGWVFFIGSIAI